MSVGGSMCTGVGGGGCGGSTAREGGGRGHTSELNDRGTLVKEATPFLSGRLIFSSGQ